jgi:hypothetical protein
MLREKKEHLISVEPHEWVSYIQELFAIHIDRTLEGTETAEAHETYHLQFTYFSHKVKLCRGSHIS